MVSTLSAWVCRFAPRRPHLVLLHRWTGLAIAFFLVVACLTGSLLSFEEELDTWLAWQRLRPCWTPTSCAHR